MGVPGLKRPRPAALRPYLRLFLLSLLVFAALGDRLSFFRHNIKLQVKRESDDAVRSDERFGRVAASLRGTRVVGYVGADDPVPYYLAQFSLAPVTVVRGSGPDLVIVDNADAGGLPLVEDFGDGLTLHRK